MIDKRYKKLEARANILKAMAHPTRLFIVEELAERKHNVGELTEKIGADISTISKHLTVLKSVGIIHDERKGTSIFYHLSCPCVLNFYECVEGVIRSKAEEQAALLE
ncbi:MAG: helix-turn-helix transcriptional regulator [bacterium]|nr:helix-turn-helix transcriptional regulator [bacterium]